MQCTTAIASLLSRLQALPPTKLSIRPAGLQLLQSAKKSEDVLAGSRHLAQPVKSRAFDASRLKQSHDMINRSSGRRQGNIRQSPALKCSECTMHSGPLPGRRSMSFPL